MVSKQKPNSCALKEKLEILKRLNNDKNITQLSIEFGVGKANISDYKKPLPRLSSFDLLRVTKLFKRGKQRHCMGT